MIIIVICIFLAFFGVYQYFKKYGKGLAAKGYIMDELLMMVLGPAVIVAFIIGCCLTVQIGNKLPVKVASEIRQIQELSSQPGYWVKEMPDGNYHKFYVVQADGQKKTYQELGYNEFEYVYDGGNYVESSITYHPGKLIWLYASTEDVSKLEIHISSPDEILVEK